MTDEILTVMWKEWKSMFRVQGGRSRFILLLLSPVILSVVMPLIFDSPEEWTDKIFPVILALILPMISTWRCAVMAKPHRLNIRPRMNSSLTVSVP